jgi:hypothetical protein
MDLGFLRSFLDTVYGIGRLLLMFFTIIGGHLTLTLSYDTNEYADAIEFDFVLRITYDSSVVLLLFLSDWGRKLNCHCYELGLF